jgi:hypothetical protein
METSTSMVEGISPASWQDVQSLRCGAWWWQIWQPRGGANVSFSPDRLRWQVRHGSF